MKTKNTHKSSFILGILFVLGSFLILGAMPSSASAATWCAKDPSNVVHVFASGPACTQGRDASWNICGPCAVWCAVGKDKKAVNAFPSNAACTQSIANSGVTGGSCRQCTSIDIATINNKLKPYYLKSGTTNSDGFLFNFGSGGIFVPNFSGSGSSYVPLSSAESAGNTGILAQYCDADNNSHPDLASCQNSVGGRSCGPCPYSASNFFNVERAGNTNTGTLARYCDADNNSHPDLASCQNSVGGRSCGPCPYSASNPSNISRTGGTGGAGITDQKGPDSLTIEQVKPDSGTCPGDTGSLGIKNPLGSTCTLYDFFQKVLKVAEQIGGVIIVLAIIYTGFLFVKAQGNAEELETAKRAFVWTVIGALILLGATVLSTIIKNTIDAVNTVK